MYESSDSDENDRFIIHVISQKIKNATYQINCLRTVYLSRLLSLVHVNFFFFCDLYFL